VPFNVPYLLYEIADQSGSIANDRYFRSHSRSDVADDSECRMD
jgi:hypothetical protein